jgi:hypothetical protein
MSRRATKKESGDAEAMAVATEATEPTSAAADTPALGEAPLPVPEPAAPPARVAAEPGSTTTLPDDAEATMASIAASSSTQTGSLPPGTFRVQVVLDVSDPRAMFLPMQNVTLTAPGSNVPLALTIGPTILHGTVPDVPRDAFTDAGVVAEGLEATNTSAASEAMPPEESDPATNSSARASEEDVSANQSTTNRDQSRKRRKRHYEE